MKFNAELWTCPDPTSYILVRTKEGAFWRKKRGQGAKGASLNEGYRKSAEGMAVTAPAAKRIATVLKPYLDGVSPGRLTVRISGRLRKAYNATGHLGYRYLEGFEPEPGHPLAELMKNAEVLVTADRLEVRPRLGFDELERVDIENEYYFELISISGDCSLAENELVPVSVKSDVYQVNRGSEFLCQLALPLAAECWIALLKVSSNGGQEIKVSAIKVIAVSDTPV